MKSTPPNLQSLSRAALSWAVASSAVCLGVAVASAQTPSSSPPTRDATSTSPAYNSSSLTSSSDASGMDKNGTLKRSDRHFITKVAEGNEKEVAMAQLAAERASSSEVRTYAQRLVTDHQKMKGELTQLAQRKGVALETGKSMRHSSTGMGTSTDTDTRTTGAAGTGGTSAGTGLATHSSTNADANTMAATDDATSDRHYRSLAKKSGRDFDKEFVEMMVDDHKKDVKMFEKEAKDADDTEVRQFAASHLATLQAHLDQANSLSKTAAE